VRALSGALRSRNFRLLLACDVISLTGSAVALVAVPFAVLAVGGSAMIYQHQARGTDKTITACMAKVRQEAVAESFVAGVPRVMAKIRRAALCPATLFSGGRAIASTVLPTSTGTVVAKTYIGS
jgi:hypothetical protein